MILAINVGNTHTVFGAIDGKNVVKPVMELKTDINQTAYGYAAEMAQIFTLSDIDVSKFEGAILSSVVPPVTEVLKKAVKTLAGLDTVVVGAGVKTGLHIMIDDPGTIASDLVATAVAAKEEYPLPCVIVDMGTATTLTVVDEKGRYIGGSIMPGVGVSLKALAAGASLLPDIDVSKPKKAVASSTVDSMKSGVVYGFAGAVDGILDRFDVELGREPASVVTTGGIASVICPHCKREIQVDEDLLLKGLGIIYAKNKQTK